MTRRKKWERCVHPMARPALLEELIELRNYWLERIRGLSVHPAADEAIILDRLTKTMLDTIRDLGVDTSKGPPYEVPHYDIRERRLR